MRGDRPTAIATRRLSQKATPYARGSTPGPVRGHESLRGYPVCAGIDPPCSTPFLLAKRLPRMRGDRPPPVRGQADKREATPYARGSTTRRSSMRLVEPGYPVCAGIDPTPCGLLDIHVRLPRMRGDRPGCSFPVHHPVRATPYARGSTARSSHAASSPAGYPVCAGIDLTYKAIEESESWLPRMLTFRM